MSDFTARLLEVTGYAFLASDEELLEKLARIRDVGGPLFKQYKTAKAFNLEPHLATPEMVAALAGLEAVLSARARAD